MGTTSFKVFSPIFCIELLLANFPGLSTEDYKKVMTVLEQAILATDLASYFEKRDKFKMAADDGEIDWQVIHQSCNKDSSNPLEVGNLYQSSTTLGLDLVSSGPPKTN